MENNFSFDTPKEDRANEFREKYCKGIVPAQSVLRGDKLKEARLTRFLKHSGGIPIENVLRGDELKKARFNEYAK